MPSAVLFRITYARYSELRDDTAQMAHGGLLVKVHDVTGLELDTPVTLELVLPDGAVLKTEAKVLQVLAGHGVAVAFGPELLAEVRRRPAAGGQDRPGAAMARHERVAAAMPGPPTAAKPEVRELTVAEKIQLALHGNRDQRNAILRDSNRTLHPYVLKNPGVNAEDVLAIAKNAQVSPELLKQIADRREWLERPLIAVALVRNPKTPATVALRALDHVPDDTLRQLAKGGAMPHVVQAARKKILR